MFDYIHTDIKDLTAENILSCHFLDFITPVSTSTGEINPSFNRERKKTLYTPKMVKRANFKGLTISVTNDRYVNLQGSLHEFYHGNNSGDFTSIEVELAINEICSTLNINPHLTPLHNLEFGVNIILPFPVTLFLDSIQCYKGKRPDRSTYSNKGHLIKFHFEQYEIKLYDKGKQHGLSKNVLRIEIKVRRMQFLHAKKLDLKTLGDLMNRNYYEGLKVILMNVIQSVVICEKDNNKGEMSLSEKRLFSECSNPNYWFTLWDKNQSKYRKKLSQFRKLNDKYGQLKIHSTVVELVSKKWDELTLKTGTDITERTLKSGTDITALKFQQISTSGTDITLQIIGNIQPPVLGFRKCKSCGRDISNQKEGSVFCSEKLYGTQGKKCRNWDSNPRNNFLKKETANNRNGLLFDTNSFIKDDRLRAIICK